MVIVDTDDVIGLNKLWQLPQLLSPLKFLPAEGSGFLRIVPLPIGILVLACFFNMIALSSLIHNAMLYDTTMSFGCLLIYIFDIYIIVTWVIVVFGMTLESFPLVRYALFMWTFYIILWIFVVISTFFEYGTTVLCVESRCPESLWLYSNIWHEIKDPLPEFRPPLPIDNVMDMFRDTGTVIPRRDGESSSSSSYLTAFKGLNVIDDGNRSIKNKMIFIKYLSKEKNDDKDDPIKLITSFQNIGINDVKYAKNVSFVILIIMILFNSVILFYSWYIMLGYYAQVKCTTECLCVEEEHNYYQSRRRKC